MQCVAKGHLISKGHFGFFNSSKKNSAPVDYGKNLNFQVVFWKNWRHQKGISKLTDLYAMQRRDKNEHFRINKQS